LPFFGLTDAASVYLGHRLIKKGISVTFLLGFAIVIANIPAIARCEQREHRVDAGRPQCVADPSGRRGVL
jgi:hypothetical protein